MGTMNYREKISWMTSIRQDIAHISKPTGIAYMANVVCLCINKNKGNAGMLYKECCQWQNKGQRENKDLEFLKELL